MDRHFPSGVIRSLHIPDAYVTSLQFFDSAKPQFIPSNSAYHHHVHSDGRACAARDSCRAAREICWCAAKAIGLREDIPKYFAKANNLYRSRHKKSLIRLRRCSPAERRSDVEDTDCPLQKALQINNPNAGLSRSLRNGREGSVSRFELADLSQAK
jgi:hypothetical protein